MNTDRAVSISAFPKCYLEDIVAGRLDLFAWIDMARELEPDGLEIYRGFLRATDDRYLEDVRRAAGDAGFELPMLCYSPDFTHPDPAVREHEVEKQREAIRVTAALGGSFCRTLSGQRRPDVSVDEGVGYVVDAISACLPTAEEFGICLVIENHYKDSYWLYPEFAQHKEVFFRVVDAIDSPWLGVQFDPSNSLLAGDDPLGVLAHVKHRVRTVHASDRHPARGHTLEELAEADGVQGYAEVLRHGVTGRGLNDYDAIFATLAGAGFRGWMSIEDGMNGMDEMKESIEFLRRMRKQYFGE